MPKARVVVVTGPGKGKTTGALGMVLRALGHGKRVLLVRFCKAVFSGELAILAELDGVTVHSGPRGMTPPPDHPDFPQHVRCARDLFAQAVLDAPGFDMIVLDEICGAAARGLVDEEDVVRFLEGLRPEQTAVLTGRDAGLRLIAAADTVSDIQCLKHGFRRGITAQEGVEW